MTTTTQVLTAETINLRQIESLRAEALAASDYDQAAICDLALEGEIDLDDYTTLSERCSRDLHTMTREAAYRACADAINAGQG